VKEEQIHIKEYIGKDFYCVDGFPKDGLDCVVVIPAPMREQYLY